MALDTANALTSLSNAKDYLGIGTAAYQVTDIECLGNAAGSLSGKYWLLSSTTVDYYVWYDISDGSVDPAVSGRTGIEVDIAGNKPAASVATSTKAVIDALGAFGASVSGPVVTVTNAVAGEVSQPLDGDTGFNIVVVTRGETGDSGHDESINQHINRASWELNTLTGRQLLARDLTEYYDGDGSDLLILRQWPINSVTSIYIDAGRSYGSDTLVSSDDYAYYDVRGTVGFDGASLTPGMQSVKITYNAGYTTIPPDIEGACLQMVAIDHKRETEKRVGVLSRSDELGGSITYVFDTPFVDRVVAKYARKYR